MCGFKSVSFLLDHADVTDFFFLCFSLTHEEILWGTSVVTILCSLCKPLISGQNYYKAANSPRCVCLYDMRL